MDFLPDLVATHCARAWQSEQAFHRLAAEHGVGAEHATHLLRFAVQRIAEGTADSLDPYEVASDWVRAR